jgi:hypothetical protein
MVGVVFPLGGAIARVVENNFPVETVRYLDTHPVPGPLYNSYESDEYPLSAQGPEHKLSID